MLTVFVSCTTLAIALMMQAGLYRLQNNRAKAPNKA